MCLCVVLQSLLVMYGALGMLPFAGFTLAWFFINLLLPFDLPTAAYPVVVLGLTGALVAIIVEQAELSSPKIVKGAEIMSPQPCCVFVIGTE